ncbi:MAG: metallophosphoesterase [Ileibacterium sp.]|nr:metallophosphoesterase [Ileibacterium sp.]
MIYITGDIHGAFDIHKINPDEFIPGRTLTPNDYVIICGDFGCIWDGGSSDRFWLNWLESLPWNTVFIDGNHENFSVLNAYPEEEWHGGKVHRIRSNIFHLKRGEVFDIEGHSFLAMGGAFSHDVSYRQKDVNWWQEEMLTKEEAENARENLEKRDWKVDYVLSHDIYKSHPLSTSFDNTMDPYNDNQVDIQQALEDIRTKLDYQKWFHGHYHKDLVCEMDGKPTYTMYDNVMKLEDFDHCDTFKSIGSDQPVEMHNFQVYH